MSLFAGGFLSRSSTITLSATWGEEVGGGEEGGGRERNKRAKQGGTRRTDQLQEKFAEWKVRKILDGRFGIAGDGRPTDQTLRKNNYGLFTPASYHG